MTALIAAAVLFMSIRALAQPPGDPSAQPNPSTDTIVKPPGAPPNQGSGSSGDVRGDKLGGRLNPAVPTMSREGPTPARAPEKRELP